MFGFKYKFSWKFYLGILLVLLSFVIGKVTQAVFIIYFNDSFLRGLSLVMYIVSWPMLLVGVWWVGKEYTESVKKYVSYKFYYASLKNKTKKVKEHVKNLHHRREA
jgi:hypothetical protein